MLIERTGSPSTDGSHRSFSQAFIDAFLPPNWMTLKIGAQRRALELMAEAGICLVWVPRSEIVDELLGR
jgi:hypothetical protein